MVVVLCGSIPHGPGGFGLVWGRPWLMLRNSTASQYGRATSQLIEAIPSIHQQQHPTTLPFDAPSANRRLQMYALHQ